MVFNMFAHYKFKSAQQYDTAIFDGFRISVKDLKNAIMQQKKIGKCSSIDLQVTNAQTNEVYKDESSIIPRNGSFIIARIPVTPQKTGQWTSYRHKTVPTRDNGGPLAKAIDLSSLDASEDDKIKAVISQSTQNYDPSNYMHIRSSNQVGPVPARYKCYNCHQRGHWIRNCPSGRGPGRVKIRTCSGIPTTSMVVVEGPQVPGALITPNGQFAVPLVHYEAYTNKCAPSFVLGPELEIPDELICKICSERMTEAAMIPCCGNSFCDDCIRGVLLESDDHECPACHKKNVSPDALVANEALRNSVNFMKAVGNFKNRPIKEPVTEIPYSNTLKEFSIGNGTKRETVILEADRNVESIKTIEINCSAKFTKLDLKVVFSATSSKISHESSPPQHDVIPPIKSEDVRVTLDTCRANNALKSIKSDLEEDAPGVSSRGSPKEHCINRELPIDSSNYAKRARQSSCLGRHSDEDLPPSKISRIHRSSSFRSYDSDGRRSPTPTLDEPVAVFPTPINTAMLGYPIAQGSLPNNLYLSQEVDPSMVPGPFNVDLFPTHDSMGYPLTNCYLNYPSGSEGDYDRTPEGVIEDPLAAFDMYLREKDEQKRRAAQRSYRREKYRSRRRSPDRRRSRSPMSHRPSSRSNRRSSPSQSHRRISPLRQLSPTSEFSRRGPYRYRSPLRSRHIGRYHDDIRIHHRDRRSYDNNSRNRDS